VAVQMTNLTQLVIGHLAAVRACETAALEAAVTAGGGDLELDSKEAQTVAVLVEMELGMEGMIRPEDIKRENLTTLRALEVLIERRRVEKEEAS
jgi:hypothetical protein